MLPQCACLLSYLGSVYLLHQSADSLVTPHRFVRLLFGKTSQNWCSCGVVPQMLLEIRSKFHRTCVLILCFTAQSASSLGIKFCSLHPASYRSVVRKIRIIAGFLKLFIIRLVSYWAVRFTRKVV